MSKKQLGLDFFRALQHTDSKQRRSGHCRQNIEIHQNSQICLVVRFPRTCVHNIVRLQELDSLAQIDPTYFHQLRGRVVLKNFRLGFLNSCHWPKCQSQHVCSLKTVSGKQALGEQRKERERERGAGGGDKGTGSKVDVILSTNASRAAF